MLKLIIKHFILFIADIFLFIVNLLFVSWVLSAFTKADKQGANPKKGLYTWGGWFGTYDWPPQGNKHHIDSYCWFPGHITGFKGYLNRVAWIIRNPCYGYQKAISYRRPHLNHRINIKGNPNTDDSIGNDGYRFSRSIVDGKTEAFEFYLIFKYPMIDKCLRIRWGWKLHSSRFSVHGFAPFVDTIQPWKTMDQ